MGGGERNLLVAGQLTVIDKRDHNLAFDIFERIDEKREFSSPIEIFFFFFFFLTSSRGRRSSNTIPPFQWT